VDISHENIYSLLPVGREFTSKQVNILIGDTFCIFDKKYSVDMTSILKEMRDKGMVLYGGGGDWWIKK